MKLKITLAVVMMFLVGAMIFLLTKRHGEMTLFNWFELQQALKASGSTNKEVKYVVRGRNNWLYYQESLLPYAVQWVDNKPAVKAFSDSLATRGITLFVVPVPDKLQVYPQHFFGFTKPAPPKNYWRWVSDLRAEGVHVVDAMPAFLRSRDSMALFEPYETHFTSQGRMLLAKLVADSLKNCVATLPKVSLTLKDTARLGTGNLYYMLHGKYVHYNVQETCVWNNDEGRFYFDPPSAQVIILGDSNAGQGMTWNAHVGALIAACLGVPTLSISKVGAANIGATLFKGKGNFLKNRKVLVWIFDGRELYGNFRMPQF